MGTDLGKIKCYALQSLKTTYIKLPENVTEIEYNVTYLSNIQKIEISSNIEKINSKAFVNSQELIEVIIHKEKIQFLEIHGKIRMVKELFSGMKFNKW